MTCLEESTTELKPELLALKVVYRCHCYIFSLTVSFTLQKRSNDECNLYQVAGSTVEVNHLNRTTEGEPSRMPGRITHIVQGNSPIKENRVGGRSHTVLTSLCKLLICNLQFYVMTNEPFILHSLRK